MQKAPEGQHFVSDELSLEATHRDILVPAKETGEFLNQLMHYLYGGGISSILVEGGTPIFASFIENQIAHRIYIFQAPILLGSKQGRVWTEEFNVSRLAEGIRFENLTRENVGSDLLISGRLALKV